jgi:hypothetical protein
VLPELRRLVVTQYHEGQTTIPRQNTLRMNGCHAVACSPIGSLEALTAPNALTANVVSGIANLEDAIYQTILRRRAQRRIEPEMDCRALARFYVGVAKAWR